MKTLWQWSFASGPSRTIGHPLTEDGQMIPSATHYSPLLDFLQFPFHFLLSDLLPPLNFLPWQLRLCHFLFPFLERKGGREEGGKEGGRREEGRESTSSYYDKCWHGPIYSTTAACLQIGNRFAESGSVPCATQRSQVSVGHRKGCQRLCNPAWYKTNQE